MSRRLEVLAVAAAVLLGWSLHAATGAEQPECANGGCKPDPLAELEPMRPNLGDLPSLQRGMALYMNYCLGCHSLKYQRYERTADDLGIRHEVALRNLVFTEERDGTSIGKSRIGSLIENSMPGEFAKEWFGAPPPDLTMVDRVRGTAWVYNMLRSFYVDVERPFGVNNRVFPDINMPHALIGLQGVPEVDCRGYKPVDPLTDVLADGVNLTPDTAPAGSTAEKQGRSTRRADLARQPNCNFVAVAPGSGSMTAAEYDQAAYDIANFLHYVGEPGRADRQRIGYWVLAFLAGLFVLATLLNREYWKDVRHV